MRSVAPERGNSVEGLDLPQRALPKCADGHSHTMRRDRSLIMMDVLMLALTFAWFALAIGYAYACERL
jgi:hypothetical protein